MKMHARIVNTLKSVFPNVQSCTSFISTYGAPWGFAVASTQEINTRPEPEVTDKLLAEKTIGGFRMFDGITLLGLMQVAGHLRKVIATETEVYTMAAPPKFFGKGSVGQ